MANGKIKLLKEEATQNWAEIPDSRGCQASYDGLIANRRGKILRQWRERRSQRVRLNGRSQSVARLVLSAWSGTPLCKGFFPRHRNGDRSDNCYENLMWAGKADDE